MQAMDWQDAETSTIRVERVARFSRGAGGPAPPLAYVTYDKFNVPQ
jgi:hypothetical protein